MTATYTPEAYLAKIDAIRDSLLAAAEVDERVIHADEYDQWLVRKINGVTERATYAQKMTALREARAIWRGRR